MRVDFPNRQAQYSGPDFQSDDEHVGEVGNDAICVIRSTIAEEMNIEIQESGDAVSMLATGIDSIMDLTILSSLTERTAILLVSDFSTKNTTIKQVKTAPRPMKERKRPILKQRGKLGGFTSLCPNP